MNKCYFIVVHFLNLSFIYIFILQYMNLGTFLNLKYEHTCKNNVYIILTGIIGYKKSFCNNNLNFNIYELWLILIFSILYIIVIVQGLVLTQKFVLLDVGLEMEIEQSVLNNYNFNLAKHTRCIHLFQIIYVR